MAWAPTPGTLLETQDTGPRQAIRFTAITFSFHANPVNTNRDRDEMRGGGRLLSYIGSRDSRRGLGASSERHSKFSTFNKYHCPRVASQRQEAPARDNSLQPAGKASFPASETEGRRAFIISSIFLRSRMPRRAERRPSPWECRSQQHPPLRGGQYRAK